MNLETRAVEVYSDPDAASGAYRGSRTVTATETVTSEALPELSFPVAEIFR